MYHNTFVIHIINTVLIIGKTYGGVGWAVCEGIYGNSLYYLLNFFCKCNLLALFF